MTLISGIGSNLYVSGPIFWRGVPEKIGYSAGKNWVVPPLTGDRTFSVAGPVIWNSIPESIGAVDNVHTFKHQLKTHFLTNSTDFMSFHSAAILTVLCYIVLPSQSGSCALGIKDTIRCIAFCLISALVKHF